MAYFKRIIQIGIEA